MPISLGMGTVLGIGEESTHGTAVSRTNWIGVTSVSQPRIIKPTTPAARLFDGVTNRESYEDSVRVSFSIAGTLHYEGLGMLLKHAMGGLATSGTGSPYTHTYTMTEALPTGLTMEVIRGNATNSEVFAGGSISRLVITGQHGQALTYNMDITCQSAATRGSAGTPSTPTYSPVLSKQLYSSTSYFSWNSRTIQPLSFTLTIDNNLDTEIGRMGSEYRDQPVRAGRAPVTLECVHPYQDSDNLYNDYIAKTAADMNFTFRLSANAIFAVKLANAKLESVDTPLPSTGRLDETLMFTPFADASEEACTITVTNTQSSGLD